MKLYGPFGYWLPFGLWAPLKVERSSSTTTFEFISSQSTTLEDASEQSWQNTITQGFLWTAISVILVPVTLGWSVSAQVVIAVALGFASTVTAVAYQSPSPVTSGDYIDLALDDYSSVPAVDEEGNIYLQLQSYAVVEAYLAQSANGGASETITFTSGQKAWYVDPDLDEYYAEKTLSFPVPTIVEPYTSADVNHPSETPSTPSGPTSGYRNVWYTYSSTTTDPDGDDVRYEFEFSGPIPTVSFMTGWYASGQTGSITVMWETTDPPGTYYVRVRAQDVYGLWSSWSPSLTVNIYNRAPNTPSTPSGTTSGYTGTSYSYSTSTTDPDGDNVCYQFDWGDGSTTTTGWYASGATASASHTWSSSGTYYVKVKAQDSYSAWSGWSSSLTVTISSGGGGGGGGCPTLFVWNGKTYVKEGLLDIHAESDVTVDYRLKYLKPVGSLCLLSLRELDNYTSHIDYVKLYAVDAEGNWHECVLVSAYHSKLGKVTTELCLDDDIRVDLAPLQRTELLFQLPEGINNIQYFIFELNGYNLKLLK